MHWLTDWCKVNLSLNVENTEEMVVDSRKVCGDQFPIHINGSSVDNVTTSKFLAVYLADKQNRQALQRAMRSAEHITHMELPDLQTIYYKWCQTKARRIVKDPIHPDNRLFSLL
ncbi:hypothetical protein P4O66_018581, partial [Electrophorus voltai]